ncbi:MAG: hypothetical protein UX26_C0010G0007 [Parcubacteria group bacterium GW2011_GWC1_45_9]|nr:MAG: hypothetical protein UW89_C0015G0003 [Parcubacteria group bacterium GW2011_GWB1_45_10]KKU17005.1 MAG: hypothetical protein UX26_C0010G0007 [Parcubacteria group bacterium GW2011_GWC1_45_9]
MESVEVAIQEYFGSFYIAKWEKPSFKWNGWAFVSLCFEWVKSYGTEKDVVDECKANGFKIIGFVSSPHLPKEKERQIWESIQVLVGAEA